MPVKLTAAWSYLKASLAARHARARARDPELGASVVEWVVITAIVVVLIGVVAAILVPAIEGQAKSACTSISGAGGTGSGASCN
jgi:hypothetical protein